MNSKSVILPTYIYIVCTLKTDPKSYYPVVARQYAIRFFVHLDEAYSYYTEKNGKYDLEELVEFGKGKEFTRTYDGRTFSYREALLAHRIDYRTGLEDMEFNACDNMIVGFSMYYEQSFDNLRPGAKLPRLYYNYTEGICNGHTISKLDISLQRQEDNECACTFCKETKQWHIKDPVSCKGEVVFYRDIIM